MEEDGLLLEGEELPEEEKKRGVWVYFVAIFIILIMTFWVLANYVAPIDPSPQQISSLEDVKAKFSGDWHESLLPRKDVYSAMNITSMKPVANFISTTACSGKRVCYAKALYLFVRNTIKYINDPLQQDFIQAPEETLLTGGGDCDDGAVLLASLLGGIGIETEFVFKPEHVLLRAWMPEAAKHYKMNGDWVYMDWTCSRCEFGKVK